MTLTWVDITIQICIAVFGSITGAAAGCFFSYKYLQRKTSDAVNEYIAILSSDEITGKIKKYYNGNCNHVVQIRLISGQEYRFNRIYSVDKYTFTAEYSLLKEEENKATDWGVGSFRFVAISFYKEERDLASYP